MGLIRETIGEIEASYGSAMQGFREDKEKTIGDAIEKLGIDRAHTLETEDPDTAFIHFLGERAFHNQAFRVFRNFTSQIRRELDESVSTPILFQGVNHDKHSMLPIEPEYVRPWYTSLGLVEGSGLFMQSSIETRSDIETAWDQTADMTIRRLGIAARTATTKAALDNNEQVQEAAGQPIIEGDVLPLYLEVETNTGSPGSRRVLSRAFDKNGFHNFLPHNLKNTGIGWGEIACTLKSEMSFGKDLHYHYDIGVPPELTDGDKNRYMLIDDLVSTLGVSSDGQPYIDYLHDLPTLTARHPGSSVAA